MLQSNDLKRRRDLFPDANEMFLAYHVLPAKGSEALHQPLILDVDQIYNRQCIHSSHNATTTTATSSSLSPSSDDPDYIRGALIGFVEVTQRPYRLDMIDNDTEPMRPILTNLAVARSVRQAGIGSQLLTECERFVTHCWQENEIVLEVEDYSTHALNFYTKRGYAVLCSNTNSQRFDVSGMVLRKVTCTREVLRKTFSPERPPTITEEATMVGEESSSSNSNNNNNNTKRGSFQLFQRLRQTVGA